MTNNGTDPYGNRRGNSDNRPIFENRDLENGYDNRYDNWNTANAFDDRYGENNGDENPTQEPSYNAHGYDFFDNKNRDEDPTYIQPIEMFHMFESAPKFGLQHNLLFSVNISHFFSIINHRSSTSDKFFRHREENENFKVEKNFSRSQEQKKIISTTINVGKANYCEKN